MENAADALKMAFAMFVFIIALTLALSLVAKAKNTSDTVLLYSDKTIYQELTTGDYKNEAGRKVGVETVISTLYKMDAEQLTVIIKGKGNTYNFQPATSKSDIEEFIKTNLTTEKTYTEQVIRLTTSGSYRKARDGTKIKIADEGDTSAGSTTILVVYREI